ncbi:MAG TPA: hypothetical protein V6C90_03720 [Coleofasciculaceae cyanobacterium]
MRSPSSTLCLDIALTRVERILRKRGGDLKGDRTRAKNAIAAE